MDEDIIEGEVIEPGTERVVKPQISAEFKTFDEKKLNPLLRARARDFEQRLNLLTDYQQALLRILPDDPIESIAQDSKPTVPLVRQVLGACGETLVHLGTRLLISSASEQKSSPIKESGRRELPFDKPFVFCYPDEGGENEPTK